MVQPKKHLGQHFLTDHNIAEKIAGILPEPQSAVLEIGPGTGMMTQYLFPKFSRLYLAEVDQDSISYLKDYILPEDNGHFVGDFLALDFSTLSEEKIAVIGNFPYNISSQIVFKIIENREKIPVWGGMFQKEVAQRLAAPPGSKVYGITSVLTQAFYEISYLFSVSEKVFNPPPKVQSGVILCTLKDEYPNEEQTKLLFKIVKAGFNQRRKKFSNSLGAVLPKELIADLPFMSQRPEELSVEEFLQLTDLVQERLSQS